MNLLRSNPDSLWWLSGSVALLILIQSIWCLYVAYPMGFEKRLKAGKNWVYIPISWRGFYKTQVVLLSRILVIAAALATGLLVGYLIGKLSPLWMGIFSLAAFPVFHMLNGFWLNLRFRMQEDGYYHLHDSLKLKLKQEGKGFTDSAFKNLAAYQHQQFLRKADETGHLLKTLRENAKNQQKGNTVPVEELLDV